MKPIIEYIKHPKYLLDASLRIVGPIFPDKLYLSFLYRLRMGRWINWKDPKTYTEKLQWLKLYNRNVEYSKIVDKYEVKKYVAKEIGQEYIIPTIGVWDTPEEIEFDSLPDKFVLKTTHGGGGNGVVICADKSSFNIDDAKKRLSASLKEDIFKSFREWPYKNVTRRIIAEPFLEVPDKMDLKDYKIFCFNGKPRFLKVDYDRFIDHHANYYDTEWNLLPFGEAELPPVESHEEIKPENFSKMLLLAEKLSKGVPFMRVDLYNISGKIYFGELTFFPASGIFHFTDDKYDYSIGELLKLPL